MSDLGKTHSIYDGLTLHQVIALHQQALGELAKLQSGIDNELCDIRLDGEAKSAELAKRDAQLAPLVAEIRGIAEESILPDGDGVPVPVALWAESMLERFSALAVGQGGKTRIELEPALKEPLEIAMTIFGAEEKDLHVCGECYGTGLRP